MSATDWERADRAFLRPLGYSRPARAQKVRTGSVEIPCGAESSGYLSFWSCLGIEEGSQQFTSGVWFLQRVSFSIFGKDSCCARLSRLLVARRALDPVVCSCVAPAVLWASAADSQSDGSARR